MVMPIPDSAVPGAQGCAAESGIEYGDGLVKNRYIHRTFIAPTQELRDNAVRIKFNVIEDNVAGKRLVVVEDSIVRATTLRNTMQLLRNAGAAEIHLRVLSAPYRWSCFYGLDTSDRSKLIASTMSVEQIGEHLGADSLDYLELDRMHSYYRDWLGDGYDAAAFDLDEPNAELAKLNLGRTRLTEAFSAPKRLADRSAWRTEAI
ncbi:MAG: amidophosphoribosyltransferase [Kribbellaceae bacterium]|jgi:amidophosphoribosyltransferase|nr:amidophosphoribosyltransferase [Kribbellaceae bacterium]